MMHLPLKHSEFLLNFLLDFNKPRYDGYTDQFNRICVLKIFLVASFVMGINWYHDTVACIPPHNSSLPETFINNSCWIKGFYIFPELGEHVKDSGYYGIPANPDFDGIWKTTNELCRTDQITSNKHVKKDCLPMKKRRLTQHQWLPFCVAGLSFLFYLPYLLFRVVNTDIISLRLNLKRTHITAEEIVENYFSHNVNSMRLRIFFNFVIKLLYVAVNIAVFQVLHFFLHKKFFDYGVQWIRWAREDPRIVMDFETPGNEMLPAFGICVLHDTAMSDKVTTVCGISSNIMYQYIVLVLWVALVVSIVSSLLGIVMQFAEHFLTMTRFNRNLSEKIVYRFLTLRECEYLEFLRRKDLTLFGNVIDLLKEQKMKDTPPPFLV